MRATIGLLGIGLLYWLFAVSGPPPAAREYGYEAHMNVGVGRGHQIRKALLKFEEAEGISHEELARYFEDERELAANPP